MTDVAIAVPNLNQGRYLARALESLLGSEGVTLRIAVLDGGSSDESAAIIDRYAPRLACRRSRRDEGQVAAINEGIAALTAIHPGVTTVGWLNADDDVLPHGIASLASALDRHEDWVAVAGRGQIIDEAGLVVGEHPGAPFSRRAFARACGFCQPATLVRRSAWEAVGGLDPSFDMSFDYDLWWRLASLGPMGYIDDVAARSRDHAATKTRSRRRDYFRESMAIVRRETGRVGWHWFISEALERQAGWSPSPRLDPIDTAEAGARALAAYARSLLAGARPDPRPAGIDQAARARLDSRRAGIAQSAGARPDPGRAGVDRTAGRDDPHEPRGDRR